MLKNFLSSILIISTLFLFTPVPTAHATEAIAFISSLGQSVNGTSFTAVTAGQSHVALWVTQDCRGAGRSGNTTYGAQSMTFVAEVTNSIAAAGDHLSLWVLTNPAAGSNAITATCAGATTIRLSAISTSGTSGYNSSAVATNIFATDAAHSQAVTTQNNNSWVIGALAVAFDGGIGPVADSNTTIPNGNSYNTAYTPTAQTPAGSHAIGFTNSDQAVFIVTEAIPYSAPTSLFNPWQFFDF